GSARSSNLMRTVELIVADPDIHVQKTRMIGPAGPQSAKRRLNIDTAVFPDRVVYEKRFGIALFPQEPKSPLHLLLQCLENRSRRGLLSAGRICRKTNGQKRRNRGQPFHNNTFRF